MYKKEREEFVMEKNVKKKAEKKVEKNVEKSVGKSVKKSVEKNAIKRAKKDVKGKGAAVKVLPAVLKLVVILVVVAIALYVVNIVRNSIIINKIINMQADVVNQNNYSFTTTYYTAKENATKTEVNHYYRNGINMMILNSNTNSNKTIVWYNDSTKENIVMNPASMKAVISEDGRMVGNNLPQTINESNKNYYILQSFITSEKVDGIACYVVHCPSVKYYMNKEDGLLVRRVDGKEVVNNKEYDCMTDFSNWKFNKLTESDCTRPNLMGYEVTNK